MNATMTLNKPTERTPVISQSNRRWIRWLIVAVSIPLCMAVVIAVIFGVREYDASRKIHALVDKWKRNGEPYDDATLTAWHKAHTHSEGATEWLKAISTVESITPIADVGQLPIIGSGKELPSIDPSQPWPNESAVADFLKEMEPVLQKIHQLDKYPTPVEFPINFHGFGTILNEYQAARSVQRLLQLDCEYACYRGQTDRAMQDLRSMLLLSKAIESDICIVTDLIVIACKNGMYRSIQRSLEADTWPKEKLAALRTLASETHHSPEKWARLYAGERGMLAKLLISGTDQEIAALETNAPPMPLLQTGRLKMLETYQPIQQLGKSELEGLFRVCMTFQSGLLVRDATWDTNVSMFYVGSLLGSAPQIAQAFQSTEDDRRMTVTSIALRQFKQAEGRWPNILNELEKVGLTSRDYNTLNGGQLGYSIEEDCVYLWRHESYREMYVNAKRPKLEGLALPVNVVRLK